MDAVNENSGCTQNDRATSLTNDRKLVARRASVREAEQKEASSSPAEALAGCCKMEELGSFPPETFENQPTQQYSLLALARGSPKIVPVRIFMAPMQYELPCLNKR
jgi:hypothetical protein